MPARFGHAALRRTETLPVLPLRMAHWLPGFRWRYVVCPSPPPRTTHPSRVWPAVDLCWPLNSGHWTRVNTSHRLCDFRAGAGGETTSLVTSQYSLLSNSRQEPCLFIILTHLNAKSQLLTKISQAVLDSQKLNLRSEERIRFYLSKWIHKKQTEINFDIWFCISVSLKNMIARS